MKITMVGTSGSGKTVFSAGVYSAFMKKEFEGFKIYPRSNSLPAQMIDTHKFSKDFKTLESKRWPGGTSEFELFPLDLYYQGGRIVNFDWIDYRGGLIDNPSIDLGKASDLYANIAASNAVILFADAHKLTETDDPEEAAYISGAEAVMRILNGFSINYPQMNLTFLIALSKCDAVHPKWKGSDGSYQPLIEHGMRAFQPLESTIKRETMWRGGILPVSTMGEGTVDEHGNIVKFLKPLHIEHAMSFCIGGTLRRVQDDTLQNFIKRNESMEVINQKYSGFLGGLRRTYQFFHKTNNELDTLKQLQQEQMHDIEALSRIRQPIQSLETIAMRKVRTITYESFKINNRLNGKWIGDTQGYTLPPHIWHIIQSGSILTINTYWEKNKASLVTYTAKISPDGKEIIIQTGEGEYKGSVINSQKFIVFNWVSKNWNVIFDISAT